MPEPGNPDYVLYIDRPKNVSWTKDLAAFTEGSTEWIQESFGKCPLQTFPPDFIAQYVKKDIGSQTQS